VTSTFDCLPRGPFDLAFQVQYFGEWLHEKDNADSIVLAFPVEGWKGSAAVSLRQDASGRIRGEAHGPEEIIAAARDQALACLSLDIDATEWPGIGKKDPAVAALQETYRCLRPVLFHSPYEAAAGFIIGHRITIRQKRAIVARMAEEIGEAVQVNGQPFHAFPGPRALRELSAFAGISPEKIERLHGVAQAALDGWLDRAHLRSLDIEEARTLLKTIRGVGPFFADGILHRGAGVVDDVPNDDLTPHAVQKAYRLTELPDRQKLLEIAESWKPFRTWTTVLLHVWLRREVGLPSRGRRAPSGGSTPRGRSAPKGRKA
jgi:DNA-3-methyladenine glycosylase II